MYGSLAILVAFANGRASQRDDSPSGRQGDLDGMAGSGGRGVAFCLWGCLGVWEWMNRDIGNAFTHPLVHNHALS